ncbi:hypothetical protein [Maricaulis maris]|uniref:hypothetical protein n=1 Tax=Maricaulis maris TaxID=74318 RepID=UPI0030C6B35A
MTAFMVEVIAHGLGTALAALALIIAARLAPASGSDELTAVGLTLALPLAFLTAFLVRVPTRWSLRKRFGLSSRTMSFWHTWGGIIGRRGHLKRHPLPDWGRENARVYLPGVGFHYALFASNACLVLVAYHVHPLADAFLRLFQAPLTLLFFGPALALFILGMLINPWLMFTRWDKPEPDTMKQGA